MKLGKKWAAALAVSALIITSAPGCSETTGSKETGGEEDHIDWNLEGKKPISSSTRVLMTPDEIWEITGEYMAVTMWAHIAGETARNDPDNFHQIFFSEPDRGCVEAHRALIEEIPEPPVERFISCGQASAAQGRDNVWSEISNVEKEARARRSVGLLFWSIDPPSMMTVQIAHQRGLEVNMKTNPEFARFATQYDICEKVSQKFVEGLAKAERPTDIADIWLMAEDHITECSNKVTASLFLEPGSSEQELAGHGISEQQLSGHEPHEHDELPEHELPEQEPPDAN